eukprot:6459425-Amphidinium_carterae.1
MRPIIDRCLQLRQQMRDYYACLACSKCDGTCGPPPDPSDASSVSGAASSPHSCTLVHGYVER